MTKLFELNLEGNLLEWLPDETFQNLHRLRYLSLAYNHLDSLNLAAFETVGNMAHLFIDVSHNQIQELSANR